MKTLIIHTDGGSRGNPGPAAIGMVFLDGEELLAGESAYLGHKTNNEAEYEAFKTSVQILKSHLTEWRPEQVIWQLDSKLVVEQLNKKWKIKEARLAEFVHAIWQELATIKIPYQIQHTPREKNAAADALVNQALDAQLT
jgi:ribonuclease HI